MQISEIAQAEGGDVPEIDRQPAEKPPGKSRPENNVTNEAEVHLHEHFAELVTIALDDMPENLCVGCRKMTSQL